MSGGLELLTTCAFKEQLAQGCNMIEQPAAVASTRSHPPVGVGV